MYYDKLRILIKIHLCFALAVVCGVHGQRIVTIQLDGTQYYISKMNPYASELNYFLAYQYCRSIGLQLVSFETREKADSIAEYLKNAGYNQHDFWTSGNHLGSNMLLWMSTGLPFNATFNYMRKQDGDEPQVPSGPLPMGRRKRGNGIGNTGCIALKALSMDWDTEDCTKLKDFICEQTRCYFYNYGPIPVSSAQGQHNNNNHHNNNNKIKDHPSTIQLSSSTTAGAEYVPSYLTKSTVSNPASPVSYSSTTVSVIDTTTVDSQKAAETEPVSVVYNEYNENLANNVEEKNASEDENNEIDLTHTTEPPTSEISSVTTQHEQQRLYSSSSPSIFKNEYGILSPSSPSIFKNNEHGSLSSSLLSNSQHPAILSNRMRTTKILDEAAAEENSGRNMPSDAAHQSSMNVGTDTFQWPWAKNIPLQKPIMKQTSN